MRRTERVPAMVIALALLISLFNTAMAGFDVIDPTNPDDDRPIKVIDDESSGIPPKGDAPQDGASDEDGSSDDSSSQDSAEDNKDSADNNEEANSPDDGDNGNEGTADGGEGQNNDSPDDVADDSDSQDESSSQSSSNHNNVNREHPVTDETTQNSTGEQNIINVADSDNESNKSLFVDTGSFYLPEDSTDSHYDLNIHHSAESKAETRESNYVFYILIIAAMIVIYVVAVRLQKKSECCDSSVKEKSVEVEEISQREEVIYLPKKRIVSEVLDR